MGTHHQHVPVRDTNTEDVFDDEEKYRMKCFDKKGSKTLKTGYWPPNPINQGKYLQP